MLLRQEVVEFVGVGGAVLRDEIDRPGVEDDVYHTSSTVL
jgi:hypothetical protein